MLLNKQDDKPRFFSDGGNVQLVVVLAGRSSWVCSNEIDRQLAEQCFSCSKALRI